MKCAFPKMHMLRTFANELSFLLLGPDVVVIFCHHLHHALQIRQCHQIRTFHGGFA